MKGASPALWQGHNSAGFRSFRFGDLLSLFHQIPLPSVVLCCSSVKSPVRATFGYTAEQRACLFHTDRQLPGQIIHRGPGQFLLQKVGCLGYLPGVPCGSAVLSSMYVLGPSCSFHSRGVAARCSQDILCVFFFSAPDLYLHTVHVPSSHGATTPPSGALPGVGPQGTELSLPPKAPNMMR